MSRAIFGLLSTFRAAVQHVGSSGSQTTSRRRLYLNVCLAQRDLQWLFFFFIILFRFGLTGSFLFFLKQWTLKNRGPILDLSQVAPEGLHNGNNNFMSQTPGLKTFWLYLVSVTEIEQQSRMSQAWLLLTLTYGFSDTLSQTFLMRISVRT